MKTYEAVVGDEINIALVIPDAEVGDIHKVSIQVESPGGIVHSYDAEYRFVEEITMTRIPMIDKKLNGRENDEKENRSS